MVGAISTGPFIPPPLSCFIGCVGAVSVATACLLEGSVASGMANIPEGNPKTLKIEHPIGETTILADLDETGNVEKAAILRTARKLFDGEIYA